MKHTVAVIGGGASGMLAAITAARNGATVTVFEGKERLGKKILATGNGKCNYTNRFQSPECYRGTHPEFAAKALQEFPVERTLEFFKEIGILPKDKNGYIYPNSEQAASVADTLSMELRALKAEIVHEDILRITKKQNNFLLETKTGKREADRVILCCGSRAGLSEKIEFNGYHLAEQCGHHITALVPALVQLRCTEKFFKTISGVRTEACVTIFDYEKKLAEEQGEILFTDYGLSGIPIFQVSRFAGEALLKGKKVTCQIDLLPQYTKQQVEGLLKERVLRCEDKTAEELMIGLLNHKLNYILLKECGINPTAPAKIEFKDYKKTSSFATILKCFTCTVSETNSFTNAQVVAGGVKTEELNSETMESKIQRGLYMAGELIDIEGTCGGYNLQWAWSSGYVAGLHAAMD